MRLQIGHVENPILLCLTSQISDLKSDLNMTFEEFFKKKRIDLAALEKAEPALFSEFKTHFEQMGEKSFDHSKKYWFNKLRHQYHLAPELKPEKPAIENPIAEQTVAESLIERAATTPTAKPGFVPRFKAASMARSVAEVKPEENPLAPIVESEIQSPAVETSAAAPSPKPGFVPRFKAANMPKPTSAENKKEEVPLVATDEKVVDTESAPAPPSPKLGFTPKFKAANLPKPAISGDKKEETLPPAGEREAVEKPAEPATSKMPYKPRLNMKNIPPKT